MRKTKNGTGPDHKRPYTTAQEYGSLIEQLGLSQTQIAQMLKFSARTSRRYKSGEVEVPASTLKLMRMMARGTVSKRQVKQA